MTKQTDWQERQPQPIRTTGLGRMLAALVAVVAGAFALGLHPEPLRWLLSHIF